MAVFSRFLLGGIVVTGWFACFAPHAQLRAAEPGKALASESNPTAAQLAFFEKSIRPVLVKECFSCHAKTAPAIKGGLKLDTREDLLKGGKTGPVVIPGNPDDSRLIQLLRHARGDVKMPPKKKLDDAVIADFATWVAMGVPYPRDGVAGSGKYTIDLEKGRQFWSFQPPKQAGPPVVKDVAWPRNDIDRYLLAELESKGLVPVADADPRTLLRRLSFDLIGLPPAPEEVEQFVKDYATDPEAALGSVVDRLLASPRFGERWGRHWLDVARFAESSGRANNFAYPHAWRYRDYVIASFNADKPFDQFIREQLAGDLLPARNDAQKTELLIATGFLAIGPKTHNERNPRQFQMDLADEQIDAMSQAFLGLTIACARCHDHKFDPIPQRDYYALAGIFRSTDTCYGTVRLLQNNQPASLVNLPREGGATVPLAPLSEEQHSAIEKQIQDLRERSSQVNVTGQDGFLQRLLLQNRIALLQSRLNLYDADGTPRLLAMGVRDRTFVSDSPVFNRGEIDQPGPVVRRGFPQVLAARQPVIAHGSGRLELADWVASKDNPLTARVLANRVWLHLIGRGLVATPDNFGASGQAPSHPALLDHLALSVVNNGWSVKKLIRTIVLSHAYRLSSQFDEKNFAADPENVLVWRIPRRRLEAEALRDTMLLLGGRLELTPPKGSAVARAGEGPANGPRFGPLAGDPLGQDNHRSVYVSIVRDAVPEMFTLFDFPDPSLILGERPTTTIPAQALFLMNNPFVIRNAEALADRLLAENTDEDARLIRAYRLCYSRPPSAKELAKARTFVDEYGRGQARRATWTALCQALFASAEFSYR